MLKTNDTNAKQGRGLVVLCVLRAGFTNNEHCHHMMKKYNFTRVSSYDFFKRRGPFISLGLNPILPLIYIPLESMDWSVTALGVCCSLKKPRKISQ